MAELISHEEFDKFGKRIVKIGDAPDRPEPEAPLPPDAPIKDVEKRLDRAEAELVLTGDQVKANVMAFSVQLVADALKMARPSGADGATSLWIVAMSLATGLANMEVRGRKYPKCMPMGLPTRSALDAWRKMVEAEFRGLKPQKRNGDIVVPGA